MDGERTYFFYADEGLVAEYDAAGNELRSYGYQPDSIWTTDPLWLKEGGVYYWYQNDHLGTPQELIDSDGHTVWEARYTAFGEVQMQIETITNNLRFPGQYYDVETGLHYNWFRYYEPETGRYLSLDPIGFEGNDSNLYRYAANNPINMVDPDARFAITTGVAALAATYVLASAACTAVVVGYTTIHYAPNSSDWKHCYLACKSSQICGGRIILYIFGVTFESVQWLWAKYEEGQHARDFDEEPAGVAFLRDYKSHMFGLNCSGCSCAECCSKRFPPKKI